MLFGGDARGYQAVHDAFALVVAGHELAPPKTLAVDAPLFADVLYDGESLTGDAAAKYTVETSADWLQFNAMSQTLVGAAGSAGSVTAHGSITVGGQTVRIDAPVDVPGLASSSSSSSSTSTSAVGNTLAPLVVRPGAEVNYDLCTRHTTAVTVQWAGRPSMSRPDRKSVV